MFHLRTYEDETDDWPYPHDMLYDVKGEIRVSLDDFFDTASSASSSQVGATTITSLDYTVRIEDDLFYEHTKHLFHVKESRDNEVTNDSESNKLVIKQSTSGFSLSEFVEADIFVPIGFYHFRLWTLRKAREESDNNQISGFDPQSTTTTPDDNNDDGRLWCEWRRFHRKWEVSLEGREHEMPKGTMRAVEMRRVSQEEQIRFLDGFHPFKFSWREIKASM